MPDTPSCPRCGVALLEPETGGSCPSCLLALALDADATRLGGGYPIDPVQDFLPSLPPHYRLETRVGSGGMGMVYRAVDTRLNRPVAIKAVHDARLLEPGATARFRAEALAAASLDHPFICKVYELLESGHKALLVMEFVEGETLAGILRQGRPPLSRTIELVSEIADGLANAHSVGLVHRDIKPSNVMVTPHGHVKMLDFGLARPEVLSDGGATTRPTGIDGDARAGTPHYMAPEQAEGKPITARADIFSLGVVAFECIAGELPFEGATEYIYVHSLVHDSPKSLAQLAPGTPKELIRLVERCLSKDPAQRPESAAAVAKELRRIAETSVAPTAHTLRAASLQKSRNRWAQVAVASLVAAAAIAVVMTMWWPGSPVDVGEVQQTAFVTWPSEEYGSRVSPDGRWVSFLSLRDGPAALYVQAIDGEARQVRLPEGGEIASHLWSPEGTKFACVMRLPDRVVMHIVPAPDGGAAAIQSVELPVRWGVRLLLWRGEMIYFQTDEPRPPPNGAFTMLRSINLVHDRTEEISTKWRSLPKGNLREFDVAPDGERVAFILDIQQRRDLWVANLDGSEARQLTSDDHLERRPLWTAASTVMYQSNRGGQLDLWEVSVNDARSTRLISSPTTHERPEGMTADGSIVTFQQISENADLWTWDQARGGHQLNAEASSDLSPTLAADGRTVVFQRSRQSSEALSVFDTILLKGTLDGRTLSVDANPIADGFAARLSPHGGLVAYMQRVPSSPVASLKVEDLRTGEVVTVCEACPLPGQTVFPHDWTAQNVAWTPDGHDLLFVERAPVAIRRYRSRSGLDRQPLVQVTEDRRIADIYPASDGQRLAYLSWSSSSSVYEVRVLNLVTVADGILARIPGPMVARGATISLRGWTEDNRSIIATRWMSTMAGLPRSIEILNVGHAGRVRVISEIKDVHDSTIHFDPKRALLYMTRAEGNVQNLYAYSLVTSELRRITDNQAPNVTFFGVEGLPDGSILFARDVRVQDIWLLRRQLAQSR